MENNKNESLAVEAKLTVENLLAGVKPFSVGDIKIELPTINCTIKFNIKGIYGECTFQIPIILPSEYTTNNIDLMIKPSTLLPKEDYFKYSYSYVTENDKTGHYIPQLTKKDVPGLPRWLTADEYYKMCSLKHKIILKHNVNLLDEKHV